MVTKMSALMDLVSQNQPHFKTHQALLVIGMQNDFIQPDGRLPVSAKNGYLDRIQTLIPKFRELNGNVIWVQTLYEANRIASDPNTGEGDALVVGGLIDGDESGTEAGEEDVLKDLPPEKSKSSKHKQRALDLLKRVSARRKTLPREVAQATAEQDDELFLLKSDKKTPACVPDTHGAQFADIIAMQFELPADIVIKTTNYSAFQGTSLLMTLRAKLVTEVYICGCITNVSVLATVIDAARHGVKINVIEDCLGYRKQARHELALKRMDEFFDAYLVNSADIIARQRAAESEKKSTSPNGSRKGSRGSEKPLEALVGRLSLNEGEARPSSRAQSIRSPTKILTGGQRKLSLVSVAESRKTLNSPPPIQQAPEPTDKEFADSLVRGAIIPRAEGSGENGEKQETKLVAKKIRMRSKGRKKKKNTDGDGDGEAPKEDTEAPAENDEPSTHASLGTAEIAPPVTVIATEPEVIVASPPPVTESRRSSMLSRAESVLNLREKKSKPQPLKSVASQPILSGKAENKEKERDRDSWSDRMRLSLSRAPKSDSASEAKNRLSIVSTKASSPPSKIDSRPESIAATIAEVPMTPTKIAEATQKEETLDTHTLTPIESDTVLLVPSTPIAETTITSKPSKIQSLANLPVLGPGDTIAEGDSNIIHDFFPAAFTHPTNPSKPLCDIVFTQLYNEVRWQKMLHQQGEVPRLVCSQGEFGDDGSMPVYRHPSDQTLPLLHFSPKVQVIRRRAEKLVGHSLNHVLIQMYRSGTDYISEHSDKTLDIVKGSSIVNVSFGAQRTMRLRTKKSSKHIEEDDKKAEDQRATQRVHLPHNSLFILGLASNAKWLHGIMPDKRMSSERSPAETAYNGIRISLTFRHIGTFLDARESLIWGQGATSKSARDAADVVNGSGEAMIRAFSTENHSSSFSWDETYGTGFDVLHLQTAPDDLPILFASNSAIETAQVRLMLWEAKIAHTCIDAPGLDAQYEDNRQVAYRDTDTLHTEVTTSSSILLYLDRYHPLDSSSQSRSVTANVYPVMLLATDILKAWSNQSDLSKFTNLLATLEDRLANEGGPFIAGRSFSIADCFVWPLLDEVVGTWDGWSEQSYGKLGEWYRMTWRRKACIKKLREKLAEVKGNGQAVEEKAKE
jgi:nicotinamidase-related amidase/alkylated DNA repair dioxygenase AlkB